MFLNGAATIAAVFHHSVHWMLIPLFMWQERILSSIGAQFIPDPQVTVLFFRITDQLAGCAVPIFLFVSGFYYGFANNRTTTKFDIHWLVSRIKFIWIPFAVWSTIIILMRTIEGDTYNFRQLVDIYIWGSAAGPYYYIPLIIQYIVLSPFLFYLLKHFPKPTFGVVIAIQIIASLTWYTAFFDISSPGLAHVISLIKAWHVLHNLIWFTGGMYLYLYQPELTAGIKKFKHLLPLLAVIVFVLSQLELSQFAQFFQKEWVYAQSFLLTRILYFNLIMLIILFQDTIRKNHWIEWLGSKSFGVYLTHILFLELFARGLYHFAPQLMRFSPIYWGLLMVVALAGPLIMMRIAEIQPLHRFYPYLFG